MTQAALHQRIAQLAKDDNELAKAIREQVQSLATSSAQQAAFHQGAARACEAILALLDGKQLPPANTQGD